MNYAEARQRSDKSGWAFTIRNDDDVWTAPCCRTDEQDEDGYRAHKHATKEEAEECFNDWRRDPSGVKLDAITFSNWNDCKVCGAPSKSAATNNEVGGHYGGIVLCPEHMTVETVLAQIEDSTRVIYS